MGRSTHFYLSCNKYDCIIDQHGGFMTEELKETSAFKQEWEAKKLLKRTKKKAKKDLLNRGHSPKEATGMIKQALKNIQSNKPIKRAAGRGG